MTILDRYISKEFLGAFIFGLLAFSIIIGGTTVLFPIIKEAVTYHFGMAQVAQFMLYKYPQILAFTIPMAVLLATIIAISRLNSDREIIALRASGISLTRLAYPIFFWGLILSLVTIAFNEKVVPQANHNAQKLFISLTTKDKPKIQKNINFTEYNVNGQPVRIIHVQEIENFNLKNITVTEFDNGLLTRVMRAQTGSWLAQTGWEFQQGTLYNFPADQNRIIFIEFQKEHINIKLNPLDLSQPDKNSEEMNAQELKAHIAMLKRTGKDYQNESVEYYRRFAIPFACLIFAILGISIGITPQRSSSTMGIGLSLVIIIIYYVLTVISMYFAYSKFMPAPVAVWLPNIIVGGLGLYRLNKLRY